MNPSTEELRHLVKAARQLALEAGNKIMEVYRAGFDVSEKDDRTPLTTADLASHRLIIEGLSQVDPRYPMLSEESDRIPYTERSTWRTYWLIDPLDGTREFIKRNDEFTVNIALVHDHEPVMGVVHAPALNVTYYACRGAGAFKDDEAEKGQPIKVRVLGRRKPVIAGSRSHASEALQGFLDNVGAHELISMGSALKSCLVAEGRADLYARLGPTSEWDTAAAQCVVHEAGGQVTDTQMQPLRYNTKESLRNPHFFVFGKETRDWSQYL